MEDEGTSVRLSKEIAQEITSIGLNNNSVIIKSSESSSIDNYYLSVHYIHVLKTGNSFREWHINNYNCAIMALQVMRKGLEGDEYKSKRAAIMKIQYNYRQGKHYLKTVIPVEAFNRLASIWGVKKQTIK